MHPHWATVVSILAAVVGAAGTPAPEPAPLLGGSDDISVERAQSMTLCPYVIVQNVREDREPRLIKELKCEGGVESAGGCGDGCCDAHCRHRCVELRDQVPVRYPAQGAGAGVLLETVSVGCACLREDAWPVHHPAAPHE